MSELPLRFLLVAVVAAMIGMGGGIFMAITHDFTLAPAHAHLNLLGWVSMALYGLFYRAFPELSGGRLPQVTFLARDMRRCADGAGDCVAGTGA